MPFRLVSEGGLQRRRSHRGQAGRGSVCLCEVGCSCIPLTLDPNGGTLSTTKLELKAGEKLADRLASLTPTKENYRFGMWLLAGEELGADAVMESADMTLVARYRPSIMSMCSCKMKRWTAMRKPPR